MKNDQLRSTWLAGLCAFGLLIAAAGAARSTELPQAVAAPEVRPGDSWVYRRIDRLANNKANPPYKMAVTFAAKGAIHVVVTQQGRDEERDAIYTAEWNTVASATGGVFKGDMGLFRFPLQVGKQYDISYELSDPRRGAFRVVHERSVRVVGWEKVSVPAGSFDAIRIEANGTYERRDMSSSGTVTNVFWYAPEVRRFVRWTYKDQSFQGVWNDYVDELVEFSLTR